MIPGEVARDGEPDPASSACDEGGRHDRIDAGTGAKGASTRPGRVARRTGVSATLSCPGATATEFATIAGNDRSILFRMGAASAASVARAGYRAMMAGKPVVVHGVKNKLAVQALRVSPRAAVRVVAAWLNAWPGDAPKSAPQ